jgi:hypothetical protein
MQERVEILPSRQKRIWLLFPLLGLLALVILTTHLMSVTFMVYVSALGWALVYLVRRINQ